MDSQNIKKYSRVFLDRNMQANEISTMTVRDVFGKTGKKIRRIELSTQKVALLSIKEFIKKIHLLIAIFNGLSDSEWERKSNSI